MFQKLLTPLTCYNAAYFTTSRYYATLQMYKLQYDFHYCNVLSYRNKNMIYFITVKKNYFKLSDI